MIEFGNKTLSLFFLFNYFFFLFSFPLLEGSEREGEWIEFAIFLKMWYDGGRMKEGEMKESKMEQKEEVSPFRKDEILGKLDEVVSMSLTYSNEKDRLVGKESHFLYCFNHLVDHPKYERVVVKAIVEVVEEILGREFPNKNFLWFGFASRYVPGVYIICVDRKTGECLTAERSIWNDNSVLEFVYFITTRGDIEQEILSLCDIIRSNILRRRSL
jgi:hypothetical protein